MRKLDLTNEYQAAGLHDLNEVMAILKAIRLSKHMTQADVARISGVSVSTISKYERGLFPTRVVWFAAMCRALGLRIAVEH
jgi:transcriptional regulator with XRE-family HTH domain